MKILKSIFVPSSKVDVLKHKTDSTKDLVLVGFNVCVCFWSKELPYNQGGCNVDRYQVREQAIYETADGEQFKRWVGDLLSTDFSRFSVANMRYEQTLARRKHNEK